MSGAGAAEPLYLDGAAEAFLGLFHAPATPSARPAVLLCGPFGWEDICSYRSRREWAQELAAAGHPTLRIDLPGSGDSACGPRDPARVPAWTDAVTRAAAWLRGSDTGRQLTVIGIGLGGVIACRAALGAAAIDQLVLWGVPSRGRALVRELRAFSRLEVARVAEAARDGAPADEAEGELAANGYLMSAETVAALERLDLAEIPASAGGPRRVLLLSRDALKVDERLHGLFERSVAEVTVAEGSGYGAMMREPQDACAPHEVFARVRAWLEEPVGPVAAPASVDHGATPTAPPLRRQTLLLARAERELRETPVTVERAEGRLFGVLSEPVGERLPLCAVLLNAGPQRHTGPNRMWVEIARRWAAEGVATLRLDLEGIGDSDGDAAALVRVAALYVPAYVAQARAALDMLDERGLGSRYLLLGLCSGAYWAMHAALEDDRVASAVMLNPRALIWDEWVHAVRRTRDLRERLLLGSTWRRVLQGDITLARHLETARALAAGALASPLRVRRRISAGRGRQADVGGDPVDRLFDALRERDQLVTLLLTGKEPLREEFSASGRFDRLERWPNLRMEIRGSAADTHTLTPLWLQREVHELVDEALARELSRSQG